jgi:hypothetical protein
LKRPLPLSGGILVNDPRLPTTTLNQATQRLIGLHVDSWYSNALESRHESPNRIAVNLGVQDRFLLFVNLPLRELAHIIDDNHREPKPSQLSFTSLGRTFLAENPSYPVLKLRVRPGEAYIAPTEHMIHDGMTSGMTAPDVTLSLHGEAMLLEPIDDPQRSASFLMDWE